MRKFNTKNERIKQKYFEYHDVLDVILRVLDKLSKISYPQDERKGLLYEITEEARQKGNLTEKQFAVLTKTVSPRPGHTADGRSNGSGEVHGSAKVPQRPQHSVPRIKALLSKQAQNIQNTLQERKRTLGQAQGDFGYLLTTTENWHSRVRKFCTVYSPLSLLLTERRVIDHEKVQCQKRAH